MVDLKDKKCTCTSPKLHSVKFARLCLHRECFRPNSLHQAKSKTTYHTCGCSKLHCQLTQCHSALVFVCIIRHSAVIIINSVCVYVCLQWRIDSAATSTYEIGNPPDHRGQACMKRHGVSMRHVARQVGSWLALALNARTVFSVCVFAVGYRLWCHLRLEYWQRSWLPWSGLPQETWHRDRSQGKTGTADVRVFV